MNIALIIPGGVDRSGTHRVIPVLMWLVERLARRHRVCVIELNQYPTSCTYEVLGARVHNVGRSGKLSRAVRVLRAIERNGPFDVIHGFWAAPSGLFAALAGRLTRTPAIVSLCGGELVALPEISYGAQLHWRSRAQVALGMRLATRVTASSRYMVSLARRYGIKAEEVPLGVPTDYFTDDCPKSGPPWRLLHVASLNKVKDQPTLLRALQSVIRRESNVHLDIVGEDTLNGAIQRLAGELDLSRHVTFHGFKTAEETRAFYRRAHVFILPSRRDAAPVVMLEAAAHGIPTVGAHVGYAADWHPERAIAVPVGDDVSLAQGVLALLNDSTRLNTMGQAARAWAQAHDADWTVRAFESLYTHAKR